MGANRNMLLLVVALAVLGAVIAMLYRSANNDELPEDEWLDFEHPGGV